MKKLIQLKLILITLFLLVTNSIWAQSNITEPRVAKIIVPRAIVYADETLQTPLGYIANGKLIAVGNPRRVNKEIVPTIVSGRLTYIEVSDIEYQEERIEEKNAKIGALKEHNIDIVLVKPEEKLNENNSLLLQIGTFGVGEQVKNTLYNMEGVNKTGMTSLNVTVVHRRPFSNLFYGVGWEYDFISAGGTSIKSFMMSPALGMTFFKSRAFSLETWASIDFSTGTSTKIENNFSDDPSGFMWGPLIGVRLIAAPNVKYRLFGALTYRTYSVYSMDTFTKTNAVDDTLEDTVAGFDNLTGVGLHFGISYDL
jgi:hypothetical protein